LRTKCARASATRVGRLMLVFIDESGDPGFKLNRGFTEVVVAAMAAFKNGEAAGVAQSAVEAVVRRLRISDEKFNKSRHEVRDAFFKGIARCAFRIRAIVVKKALIYSLTCGRIKRLSIRFS
jgi:hypothetical protein